MHDEHSLTHTETEHLNDPWLMLSYLTCRRGQTRRMAQRIACALLITAHTLSLPAPCHHHLIMSSLNPLKIDVLIVGAGPAGIMTALSLLKCGVKDIKLIDNAPKKTVGFADGVMPRTIEGHSSLFLVTTAGHS